jgi:hypothetical protein
LSWDAPSDPSPRSEQHELHDYTKLQLHTLRTASAICILLLPGVRANICLDALSSCCEICSSFQPSARLTNGTTLYGCRDRYGDLRRQTFTRSPMPSELVRMPIYPAWLEEANQRAELHHFLTCDRDERYLAVAACDISSSGLTQLQSVQSVTGNLG